MINHNRSPLRSISQIASVSVCQRWGLRRQSQLRSPLPGWFVQPACQDTRGLHIACVLHAALDLSFLAPVFFALEMCVVDCS